MKIVARLTEILLLLFNTFFMAVLALFYAMTQGLKLAVFLIERTITLLYLAFGLVELLNLLIYCGQVSSR